MIILTSFTGKETIKSELNSVTAISLSDLANQVGIVTAGILHMQKAIKRAVSFNKTKALTLILASLEMLRTELILAKTIFI